MQIVKLSESGISVGPSTCFNDVGSTDWDDCSHWLEHPTGYCCRALGSAEGDLKVGSGGLCQGKVPEEQILVTRD